MSDAYDPDLEPEDDTVVDELDDTEELDETLEDDEEAAPGEESEEPARQSRGDRRVAEATRIAADAKQRADALDAELQAIRAERARETQNQTAAQRAERLAQMDPEQRIEFLLNEQASNTEARLNQIQFNAYDTGDKAAFESLAARNPAIAALKGEVETELKAMRAKGQNVDRETLAAYLIGRKALNKQPRAKAAGARRAEAGRSQQAARGSSGRGDVSGGERRQLSEAAARAKRLEDVII